MLFCLVLQQCWHWLCFGWASPQLRQNLGKKIYSVWISKSLKMFIQAQFVIWCLLPFLDANMSAEFLSLLTAFTFAPFLMRMRTIFSNPMEKYKKEENIQYDYTGERLIHTQNGIIKNRERESLLNKKRWNVFHLIFVIINFCHGFYYNHLSLTATRMNVSFQQMQILQFLLFLASGKQSLPLLIISIRQFSAKTWSQSSW